MCAIGLRCRSASPTPWPSPDAHILASVLRFALTTALVVNGALLLAGWWRLRTMPEAAPHTGPLKALLGLAIVTLGCAAAIFILVPG
jgi:hypothetical protein